MLGKPASQTVQDGEKRRLHEALAAHGIQPLAESCDPDAAKPETASIEPTPSVRPIIGG